MVHLTYCRIYQHSAVFLLIETSNSAVPSVLCGQWIILRLGWVFIYLNMGKRERVHTPVNTLPQLVPKSPIQCAIPSNITSLISDLPYLLKPDRLYAHLLSATTNIQK